jgi:hypothetical protein
LLFTEAFNSAASVKFQGFFAAVLNITPCVSQPPPLTVLFLPGWQSNMCLMNSKISQRRPQPHSNDVKLTIPGGGLALLTSLTKAM